MSDPMLNSRELDRIHVAFKVPASEYPGYADEPDQHPRGCRRSDPETSRKAARRAEKSALTQTQRDLCLRAVRKIPGSTAGEISAAINLDRVAVGRRLPELRDDHLVINGPARECREMGSDQMTWLPALPPDVEALDRSFSVPGFDPQTICPCREHRRFWRSIHGPHLICAGCHPPATPAAVIDLIDVGPRLEPMIVAQSRDRSRQTLQTVNLHLQPAKSNRRPLIP